MSKNILFIGEIIEKKDILLYAINILDELNIPISHSIEFKYTNATGIFGSCIKLNNKETDYRIILSKPLLKTEDDYINTTIHELLHTINFSDGHKGQWKYYANIVNKNTKYYISREYNITLQDMSFKGLSDDQIHDHYIKLKNELPLVELLNKHNVFFIYLNNK